MIRRSVITAVVVGLVVAGLNPASPVAAKTPPAPYAGPGPYAAGVTTLDMNGTPVEVWYPVARTTVTGAAKDVYYVRDSLPESFEALLPAEVNPPFTQNAYRDRAASAKGRFPLVLFSHGFSGFRLQSTFLTTHLAEWGFVVAAPEFVSRNLGALLGTQPTNPKTDMQVLADTTDFVGAQSAIPTSRIAGTVKRGKVAVTGHSAGGFAAIQFGGRADVVTYIPLSAGGSGDRGPKTPPPDTPSLFALGGDDQVVGTSAVRQYWKRQVKAPKRLVVIGGSGHTGPTDTCDIGSGGLVQTAIDAGLPVPESFNALYDCKKPVVAHDTWPVYDHFVTAQLRWAFGIDERPIGLDLRAAKSFRPIRVTYRQVAG